MTAGRLVLLGGSSPNTPALFAAMGDLGEVPLDEVCLVGPSAEKVEYVGRFCRTVADRRGLSVRVTWETDLTRATSGASYVLNMLRVGGVAGELADRQALALSGIVGHASSYPEAMRNLPASLAAAQIVDKTAPDALWINFTNPVSILCEAIASTTELSCVGICHHASSIRADFAALLEVPAERVRVEYLGLNHVGWVTDVQVDGSSRLHTLTERLIARRCKTYNYALIGRLGAIPLQHAYSLYKTGEVVYVREKGPRGSVSDALLKNPAWSRLAHWRAGRDRLAEAVRHGEQGVVDALVDRAPWYQRCIVPFLNSLVNGRSAEHIVTFEHKGQAPGVPERTAETTVMMDGRRIRAIPFASRLPAAARVWLEQIRNSEHLLIQAVGERSRATALEALACHPNVASARHAERFLQHYQWADIGDV